MPITRYFNPHAPCGARRQRRLLCVQRKRISIHTPRVGRDDNLVAIVSRLFISIHTPRVGRDARAASSLSAIIYFNPHAPRGARLISALTSAYRFSFQSTRPAWGATNLIESLCFQIAISIHTPRVGRDVSCSLVPMQVFLFQSTRPAWGATKVACEPRPAQLISIHTPRVGRDASSINMAAAALSFNPHAPRGARPIFVPITVTATSFQSTRPAWGATRISFNFSPFLVISIHTPRVGRDWQRM